MKKSAVVKTNVNFFERYKELSFPSADRASQSPSRQSPQRLSNSAVLSPSKGTRRVITPYLRQSAGAREWLVPYNPPDRTIVMALLCEFDLQTENGIPYSGSVRVQRKTDDRERRGSKLQLERSKLM